ncbi:hypothetical protein CDAR_295671 [Caerostris darwini]|uniref:Uncharacterized protein n=1 Tax=Caerostris darwini TaxID=1538125 RepID=A0AAV4NE75_9ARAC|nr:hypothetical protein CDAR_295671 [Caerostris darwini]
MFIIAAGMKPIQSEASRKNRISCGERQTQSKAFHHSANSITEWRGDGEEPFYGRATTLQLALVYPYITPSDLRSYLSLLVSTYGHWRLVSQGERVPPH